MKWLLCIFAVTAAASRPCTEISRELRFPCRCTLGPIEEALDGNPAIGVDCDRVVFPGDLPPFPYGAPIVSFSQRWAGHQALPPQVFATSELPLRSIDLSGNLLRRLTERLLQSVQDTLIELRLANNLLGDTLNPIFSTNEFHGLKQLQILDLSGNVIRGIEEGILEGCHNLEELYLDANSLQSVPSTSLNGPKKLKVLSLSLNRIGIIKNQAFIAQNGLEKIDLSNNLIVTLEGGAFSNLKALKVLSLNHNRLSRFNSDVFVGLAKLQNLDLSENFILDFPIIALKSLSKLQYLNLSSNLIQNLNNNDLIHLSHLQELDLSRNNIGNIAPGTFLGLKNLTKLDISVNSLRTIEDDAFEGLDNLEYLNLKDNNILLIPASALGRLPKLLYLQLDYNRVAALSGDILRSIAEKVTHLVLSRNVVRELPAASFQYFRQLEYLDLTRNLITKLNSDAFSGLENTLQELHLSENRISVISGSPLMLSKLELLDLSKNHFNEFTRNSFSLLPNLKRLNLSHNEHLTMIPTSLLHKLEKLEHIDLSYANLNKITPDFFMNTHSLKQIRLKGNTINEVPDGAFVNLPNLTTIDLSYNRINNVRQGAFVNVMNIRRLYLNGNQLTSFKGEFFNTGTSLEVLDISANQISYLFPSSFKIHPRLMRIHAAHNKFNFFPAELISSLQFLEYVDLSGNFLKAIEELDFARLPRLRSLILSHNQIESISEMAFHNTTQLQILELDYNKLDRLGDRTFEGLVRLEKLNLEGNLLEDLPETIFDRSRLQMLENINLARNKFELAPLKALQKQYFFVSSVDLSHNKIKDIPVDDSTMVNIKKLDLSFNPLSEETAKNVLGEPKTVRELNLAGTGIREMTQLETPFLMHLNLSLNNISKLDETIFERTTLLEILDLSSNIISDIGDFSRIWSQLKNLQKLNLSRNAIRSISQNAFDGLDGLRQLSIHSLDQCERIEKSAFKFVPNLYALDAYNYPKLGYIDVHGLLQNLPALEMLNIETKDSAVGSDQLQPVLHPRLRALGLIGDRLRTIGSGTLSGIKGAKVIVRLVNTSLSALPPALFFPVPRSSSIILDVSGSRLTTLSAQLLSALDDRNVRITGLDTNPIVCDCNAKALRRWSDVGGLECAEPDYLKSRKLAALTDDELSCGPRRTPAPTNTPTSASTERRTRPTEPEIIWSMPTTERASRTKAPTTTAPANDDTLIIGIVGGVVAFIAILIVIICIVRLRMSSGRYGAPGPRTIVGGPVGSSCACSVKGGPPPVYGMPPPYGYAATLPHKMHPAGQLRASNYSTMGRVPYYQGTNQPGQPYFIALSSDEKIYR